MFERFVRLAQARKALKTGHYEQVLQHLGDPLVRSHRRADDIRAQALKGLLQRARKRADAGGLSAAGIDVDAVLTAQPEFDGARSLRADLDQRVAGDGERAREARKLLREARLMAEGGDLEGALLICGSAAESHELPAEAAGLHKLVAGRRSSAKQFLAKAEAAEAAGNLSTAKELLGRARALDREQSGVVELATRLAAKVGADLVTEMRGLGKSGDAAGALRWEGQQRAALPELEAVPQLQACVRELSKAEAARIIGLLQEQDHEAAFVAYRSLDSTVKRSAAFAKIGEGLASLQGALEFDTKGNFELAERGYARASELLAVSGLQKLAKKMASQVGVSQALLRKARELSGEGQLVEAREALLELLQKWPTHEAARREMEILDQGAQDKDQRMSNARELAKAGKLREASALCLSLAVPGAYGDEARLLMRDLQARMDLVRSGVQQVLGSLHNRDSCSADGLNHSLKRLLELRKIQTDDQELSAVTTAVEAEIGSLESLDGAEQALQAGEVGAFSDFVGELGKVKEQLLSKDRLAARSQDLAELAIERSETELAGGRLRETESWLMAVSRLIAGHSGLADRVEGLKAKAAARQDQAEELASQGQAKMAEHDLDRAESLLAKARAAWIDGPTVKRLEGDLAKLQGQVEDIAEVESMAKDADYGAARRRLGQMGPTENLLRTKIFDLKKNLAKAQGLDHAFLLRVDEGGEFIVMRGESVTIGNVREGSSDLPILANLAGQHARITRTMSFHGGMQDRLVKERGTISVAGRQVSEHLLKSGDRVTLGSALELEYKIPSSRSLSALLSIRGGFQVCGTDKILLMKDRGRDGRILIGSAKDVHVRVPNAEREVEIFAGKDGQIRARYEGQGEMDGRPFSGEHPIAAGSTVVCGNITFVLLPWSKADALGG